LDFIYIGHTEKIAKCHAKYERTTAAYKYEKNLIIKQE